MKHTEREREMLFMYSYAVPIYYRFTGAMVCGAAEFCVS